MGYKEYNRHKSAFYYVKFARVHQTVCPARFFLLQPTRLRGQLQIVICDAVQPRAGQWVPAFVRPVSVHGCEC